MAWTPLVALGDHDRESGGGQRTARTRTAWAPPRQVAQLEGLRVARLETSPRKAILGVLDEVTERRGGRQRGFLLALIDEPYRRTP